MRKKMKQKKKKSHKSRRKMGMLARFFHGFTGVFANGLTLW